MKSIQLVVDRTRICDDKVIRSTLYNFTFNFNSSSINMHVIACGIEHFSYLPLLGMVMEYPYSHLFYVIRSDLFVYF